MNRLSRCLALPSALALALSAGALAGCSPDNSVKSGAPVLTEIVIVQWPGPSETVIPANACPGSPSGGAGGSDMDGGTTGDATSSGGSGGAGGAAGAGGIGGIGLGGLGGLDLGGASGAAAAAGSAGAGGSADTGTAGSTGAAGSTGGGSVTDGAPCNPNSDKACRLGALTVCTCMADATNSNIGTWSCPAPAPFAAVSTVYAVFDRVISTAPFSADGGALPSSDIAMVTFEPGNMNASIATDYSPNGSATGLIFHLFAPFFGFTSDGPSLITAATPEWPSGTTVNYTLDKTKVIAKDGKTPFDDQGLFANGSFAFQTAPFQVALAAPPPEAAEPTPADNDGGTDAGDDAGADGGDDAGTPADAGAPPMLPGPGAKSQAATALFTNFVNVDDLAAHVHVTASGAGAVDVKLSNDAGDRVSINITPTNGWPANATITVTFDATTPDVLGESLGMDQTTTFMTAAK